MSRTLKTCGRCRGRGRRIDPAPGALAWIACPACGGGGKFERVPPAAPEPERKKAEPRAAPALHRPAREELTDRQERILRFMASHFAEYQRLPTSREIGDEVGIASPSGVVSHFKSLVKKGYLYVDAKLARGYRIAGLSELIAPAVAAHVEHLLRKGAKS